MTTFDNREKAFEDRYAHDMELQFKVSARRNKLLGLWAAKELGCTDADSYAKEVVLSDFEEPGEEDVVRKVAGDLKTVGIAESEVRRRMALLMKDGQEQIFTE